jgi:hypothetical protein
MWKREFGEEIKYSVPGILLNRSKKTLTERRRLLNIMQPETFLLQRKEGTMSPPTNAWSGTLRILPPDSAPPWQIGFASVTCPSRELC